MLLPLAFRIRQRMAASRPHWMLVVIAAIGLVTALAGDHRSRAAEPLQGPQEIRALVRQLGDPIFAVRERSERKLKQIGIDTESALTEVLDDPDAELRYRARRVLFSVREANRHRRIAVFSRSTPGSGGQGLPAWTLFEQTVGDNPASRHLYLQAIRSEPALLEAIDLGPEHVIKVLQARLTAATQSLATNRRLNFALGGIAIQKNTTKPPNHQGRAVAFLLAYADSNVREVPEVTVRLFQFIARTNLMSSVTTRSDDEPLRRLIGLLILRTPNTPAAYQALQWSTAYQFKEGLVPAQAVLRTPGQPTHLILSALLAVGKLGDKQHIKQLEPFLKNDTPILSRRRTSKTASTPQIRDVALAMSVHLSGQKLAAYGFQKAPKIQANFYNVQSLTFASDAKRQKALKKWKARIARSKADPDPAAKTGDAP